MSSILTLLGSSQAGSSPVVSLGTVVTVSTAALPSCTYDNGVDGVGATLTATAVGALPAINGATPVTADYIGVTGQADNTQNGVYYVTEGGDGSTAFILTRSQYADQPSELTAGAFFVVTAGDFDNKFYVLDDSVGAIGTDPIIFTMQNGVIDVTHGGTGLTTLGSAYIPTGAGTSPMVPRQLLGTANNVAVTVNASDFTLSLPSSLSLGTITAGTWNGSTISVAYGGTGTNTLAANQVLIGNDTSAVGTSSNFTYNGTGVGIGVASSSYLLHVNNAGSSSVAPLYERSALTTDTTWTLERRLATKSTNMADGFGTLSAFSIKDDAGVINDIVYMEAFRAGADNTGAFRIRPVQAGSNVSAFQIQGTCTNIAPLLGVGLASLSTVPSALIHGIRTTEQLRLGYDTSNYFSTTVSSAGLVSFNAVGASSAFYFQDNVSIGAAPTVSKLYVSNTAGYTAVPLIERANNTTNSLFSSATFQSTKNTDMGDGFGTAINLAIQDDAAVSNTVGYIGAVRANSNDTTGNIILAAYAAGSAVQALQVNYTGNVNISAGLGVGLATMSTAPTALIHGIKTTEQLRIGYDLTNYCSFAVGNTGNMTIMLSGTNPIFNIQSMTTIGGYLTAEDPLAITWGSSNEYVVTATAVSSGTGLTFNKASAANFSRFDIVNVANASSTLRNFTIGFSGDSSQIRVLKGGRVSIGSSTPSTNALLDLQSTVYGFLPPRMSTGQKNAITGAAGMMLYDTSLNKLAVYNGSSWETVTSA